LGNLLPFRASGAMAAHDVGRAFLEDADAHGHGVQFYEADDYLVDAVSRFLVTGLRAGEHLVVIATAEHRDAFMSRLQQLDTAAALAAEEVTLLDARATLARFMDGGMPDPDEFRKVIAELVGNVTTGRRVRAYGEMVDLLWQAGNPMAAIRLEELWNDAQKSYGFSLLCAYLMGRFYKEGDVTRFLEVCQAHTHVIPTEDFSRLDDPHARLREISLLQQRARALENEIQHRRDLEKSLREALKERSRAEEELRACVRSEKEARERAEASDAFKELFLGILGHDLRNPLNTVLTTARIMMMAGEGTRQNDDRRVERIVSSGVRMERMITQLLDVARARLADGIPITGAVTQDLTPLVSKIVEETRAAHPGRCIEIRADRPCLAHVDADRFEQVASNLIGNAIDHGDPDAPITVGLSAQVDADMVSLSVHNHGPAIDGATMSVIFDPFKRGRQLGGRMDGLGLGLYIVDRIVSAHGGRMEVQSSAEFGTRFAALFPVASHV
jgi:signal transduction histidine kinase